MCIRDRLTLGDIGEAAASPISPRVSGLSLHDVTNIKSEIIVNIFIYNFIKLTLPQ